MSKFRLKLEKLQKETFWDVCESTNLADDIAHDIVVNYMEWTRQEYWLLDGRRKHTIGREHESKLVFLYDGPPPYGSTLVVQSRTICMINAWKTLWTSLKRMTIYYGDVTWPQHNGVWTCDNIKIYFERKFLHYR